MTKTQLYDIERLQHLLQESIIKFDHKKRFIHPRIVENFLVHFYAFKDKTKKDHIYDNLSSLFETLSNMEFEDLTPQTSIGLFDQFIAPLMSYYNIYQRFSVNIKWPYLLGIVVLLLMMIMAVDWGIHYKVGL